MQWQPGTPRCSLMQRRAKSAHAFGLMGCFFRDSRCSSGTGTGRYHGAKGHDPHAIVLYQPENSILLSADALWQNGFGVVFPELEGQSAFDEVGQTLDLIENLRPSLVVPGHGSVFQDVTAALERARSRLARFRKSPAQHHAACPEGPDQISPA